MCIIISLFLRMLWENIEVSGDILKKKKTLFKMFMQIEK